MMKSIATHTGLRLAIAVAGATTPAFEEGGLFVFFGYCVAILTSFAFYDVDIVRYLRFSGESSYAG